MLPNKECYQCAGAPSAQVVQGRGSDPRYSLDSFLFGIDCLMSGRDCLTSGLDCLTSGLDCLISGLDCLVACCTQVRKVRKSFKGAAAILDDAASALEASLSKDEL